MKLKTEISIDLAAKAIYRDGNVLLSVSGAIPYANRQASGSVGGASKEVTEMFTKAFKALLAERQEQVVKVAQAAQAECLMAAARMGEL
jgi:hypothetical protein